MADKPQEEPETINSQEILKYLSLSTTARIDENMKKLSVLEFVYEELKSKIETLEDNLKGNDFQNTIDTSERASCVCHDLNALMTEMKEKIDDEINSKLDNLDKSLNKKRLADIESARDDLMKRLVEMDKRFTTRNETEQRLSEFLKRLDNRFVTRYEIQQEKRLDYDRFNAIYETLHKMSELERRLEEDEITRENDMSYLEQRLNGDHFTTMCEIEQSLSELEQRLDKVQASMLENRHVLAPFNWEAVKSRRFFTLILRVLLWISGFVILFICSYQWAFATEKSVSGSVLQSATSISHGSTSAMCTKCMEEMYLLPQTKINANQVKKLN